MTFTPPTYEQPVKNRLGEYGISFPVGKIVWIRASDDAVLEVTAIVDPDDINAAKVGTGDFGKAIFRRGIPYSVSAGEQTLLTAAGYTIT